MNSSTRRHASSEASANCSCLRSKKLCGAPSYVTTSCSTPAAVSAASNAALFSAPMSASSPRLEREDRRLDLARPLGRTGHAVALRRLAVEPDRALEPVARRRGEPGVAAAEAEADREDRRAPARASGATRAADVGLHALRRRLPHVRHVVEVVVALRDAGRAAEVVERDGAVAALGEAQRQLLVEAVEAANVRQDHDARADGLVRAARRRRRSRFPSAASSTRSSCETAAPRDDRDRRQRVRVEAHGREASGRIGGRGAVHSGRWPSSRTARR